MDAALTRRQRTHLVTFDITDDYVRTYWVEEDEPKVYINPKHVTVSINPDSGRWDVVLRGTIIGTLGKEGTLVYHGRDWVDLMTPQANGFKTREQSHLPLVVQAVRAAAREMMPGDAEYWSEA